ncbi:MAG: hypothetical protein HQL95_05330 [Magnetococcales bacterium]|nr:hypothetical protein [Magnetococcales bacterium]
MAKARDSVDTGHLLEEEIGVEVKKILRSEMSGSVSAMARELSEDEQQLFSDSYLGSAVELMIPSAGKEQRLMEPPRKKQPGKEKVPRKPVKGKSVRKPSRKGGDAGKKKRSSRGKKR